MIKKIEDKVKKNITRYNLIEKGNHIVVGVSGGADSMMLLDFLKTHETYYDITIEAAHIHHGIREEATEDARCVKEMCEAWKIPFQIHYCNIKQIAKEKGITEEEAGRIERYNFFISLTKPNDKIATAHNRNDQVETVMMRFLRGTDIKGLGGIPPKRDNIIRPILNLDRNEIEYYCKEKQICYKDDHTNFMPIYTRNKLRLECIPYVQKNINPNIIQTLAQCSELYREEEEFLEDYVQKIFLEIVCIEDDRLSIDINKLLKEKRYMQKKLMMHSLNKWIGHTKDIALIHINKIIELLEMQNGKKISLPYNLEGIKQYDKVIILKKDKDIITNYDSTLEVGMNNIEDMNICLTLIQRLPKNVEQTLENMYTKYIDYDKIKNSLHLRTRKEKDFITLSQGSKKLKKFFIDQKVPSDIRNSTPLIADGDEVVWIIGSRLNTKYYVTKQTTKVLEIKVIKRQKS